MAEPRRIDIAEFREFGYLHEINRLFLHPLGLALEVVTEDADCFSCGGAGKFNGVKCETCDGEGKLHTERLGGVWDSREDPEGIIYGEDLLDFAKAARIADEFEHRGAARQEALGFVIQPAGPGDRPAEGGE